MLCQLYLSLKKILKSQIFRIIFFYLEDQRKNKNARQMQDVQYSHRLPLSIELLRSVVYTVLKYLSLCLHTEYEIKGGFKLMLQSVRRTNTSGNKWEQVFAQIISPQSVFYFLGTWFPGKTTLFCLNCGYVTNFLLMESELRVCTTSTLFKQWQQACCGHVPLFFSLLTERKWWWPADIGRYIGRYMLVMIKLRSGEGSRNKSWSQFYPLTRVCDTKV